MIRNALIARVMDHLDHGEGTVVLGARGMGKSVFLTQLSQKLATHRDIHPVLFDKLPDEKTMRSAVSMVADRLAATVIARRSITERDKEQRDRGHQGQTADVYGVCEELRKLGEKGQLADIFKKYFDELSGDDERLVLIFDEVEQYADPPAFGRSLFNSLEAIRKLLDQRLAFVVSGGLKLLTLDTELASTFFTRMKNEVVEPFDYDDLAKIAGPFTEEGRPLTDGVLNAILMASGGNALLSTYGLTYLWDQDRPTEQAVLDIFRDFEAHQRRVFRDLHNAVAGTGVAGVPLQVLRVIVRDGGHISTEELDRICAGLNDVKPPLVKEDVLDILRASGLVRFGSSRMRVDGLDAQPIPSLIAFRLLATPVPCDKFEVQLINDIKAVLTGIHSWAPSFYRPRDKGLEGLKSQAKVGKTKQVKGMKTSADGKPIVPESTFAAVIALTLNQRDWKCELEPQSGAGYPDIKAGHRRFGEDKALVEVKIWPRNDYKDIHAQVAAYFIDGVRAFATVMIGDTDSIDWRDQFVTACLKGKVDEHSWCPLAPPLEGYFVARTGPHTVHHFMLRLPSRH